MKSKYFSLLTMLLPALAAAEIPTSWHRCLSSEGDKPIHLEWREYSTVTPDWSAAYIRYGSNKKVVSIVLKETKAIEMAEGRPWEYDSTWVEVNAGKITGEYEIHTQGANIYYFVYLNYKTGKKFSFDQDDAAYTEEGCHWK